MADNNRDLLHYLHGVGGDGGGGGKPRRSSFIILYSRDNCCGIIIHFLLILGAPMTADEALSRAFLRAVSSMTDRH